jgi:dipeptidyl aminopeptidase/acylaminoacyl peptidase
LLGASAGAHLALLHAYKDTVPVKIKTVIDYFGPSDMTEMYNNPALPGGEALILNVMGTTPSVNSTLYTESSPINFVKHASAATIIFHGDADIVVKHEQSDSLFAKLDSSNANVSMKIYAGQGHEFVSDTLSNSFDRLQVFLVNHMN